MHSIINTRGDFVKNWDSRVNFVIDPACLPLDFEFPTCLLHPGSTQRK